MLGRKEREKEISFACSEKNERFLRNLFRCEDCETGIPHRRHRYVHCELCQEETAHFIHLFQNNEGDARIEWEGNKLIIFFVQGNHTVIYYWLFALNENKYTIKLDNYQAVNNFEPPLLSEINPITIKDSDGKSKNLHLAEIFNNVYEMRSDELNDVNKYNKPLFEDSRAQNKVFEILVKKLKFNLPEA